LILAAVLGLFSARGGVLNQGFFLFGLFVAKERNVPAAAAGTEQEGR
jgi:hypothetical protein